MEQREGWAAYMIDSSFRTSAKLVMCASAFCALDLVITFPSFLWLWTATLKGSFVSSGVILGMRPLFGAIFTLMACSLIRRLGIKAVLLLACMCNVVGNVMYATSVLTDSSIQLTVAQVVAAGTWMAFPASIGFINLICRPDKSFMAMAHLRWCVSLGEVAGLLLGWASIYTIWPGYVGVFFPPCMPALISAALHLVLLCALAYALIDPRRDETVVMMHEEVTGGVLPVFPFSSTPAEHKAPHPTNTSLFFRIIHREKHMSYFCLLLLDSWLVNMAFWTLFAQVVPIGVLRNYWNFHTCSAIMILWVIAAFYSIIWRRRMVQFLTEAHTLMVGVALSLLGSLCFLSFFSRKHATSSVIGKEVFLFGVSLLTAGTSLALGSLIGPSVRLCLSEVYGYTAAGVSVIQASRLFGMAIGMSFSCALIQLDCHEMKLEKTPTRGDEDSWLVAMRHCTMSGTTAAVICSMVQFVMVAALSWKTLKRKLAPPSEAIEMQKRKANIESNQEHQTASTLEVPAPTIGIGFMKASVHTHSGLTPYGYGSTTATTPPTPNAFTPGSFNNSP